MDKRVLTVYVAIRDGAGIFISGAWRSGDGTQGRSSDRESEVRPPEAEAVCRHCLQILTAETIKNYAQLAPDSLPLCLKVGAKRHFTADQPDVATGSNVMFR